jgi:hypothetical protein
MGGAGEQSASRETGVLGRASGERDAVVSEAVTAI